MTKVLEDLLFLLNDKLSDLLGEVVCSSGHEYDARIFRPFSPNQYEQIFLKEMTPIINHFLETASDEEKELFLESDEYKDYMKIKNPIPTHIEGEYAPNYAVVIINDVFYLLENKFSKSRISFMRDEYFLTKDTIDIYSFVNTIANTKSHYYIGNDDFSYFLGEEEKPFKCSEIQLGYNKDQFITVKLSYNNNEVVANVIDKKNSKIATYKLERDKAFIITIDKQCYCQEVKLTEEGFEVIEGLDGSPSMELMSMYPDVRVLKTCSSFSNDKKLDIDCSSAFKKWEDFREIEIQKSKDIYL